MAKKEIIKKNRELFKDKSDDDLLYVTHTRQPFSEDHIAAKQELEDRKKKKQHQQLLVEKNTNLLTKIILLLTGIILLFTIAQLFKS